MRVTIIADDNVVYVEEQPLKVDLTGLHSAIHAIQWYGTVGEMEFKQDHVTNEKLPNLRFNDFTPFQPFVDRWMEEAKKEDPAPVASAAPQATATEPMSVLK